VKGLTGTVELVKLILRRDRLSLVIWILILGVMPVGVASGFDALYPTAADLEQAAITVGGNPGMVAFLGQVNAPTLGGMTAWRIGAFLVIGVGIMSVLTLTRHTRAEEQTGRRELIGSAVVGRHAPLAAAALVVATANLLIGGLGALGLIAYGLEAPGSLALGAATAAGGWVFLGTTAVVAQITESSRATNGAGLAAIGASFLMRVAGDTSSALESLGWISPIGLAQRVRPFAGERWWVAGVLVGAAAVTLALAQAISSRRDVGAGIFAIRPGPAVAGPSLNGPFGLAMRLQRGTLIAWVVGFAIFGALMGTVTQAFVDLLEETPALATIIESVGGVAVIHDAFLASILGLFAVVAAAHGIQAVQWLRSEEKDGRADKILATPTTRGRWMASHSAFGVAVPVVDLVVAGAAAGAGYGLTVGDPGQMLRVAAGALAQVPAAWVMVGVGLALFGLVPAATRMVWTLVGVAGLVTLLGRGFGLPQWVLNLSPFTHSPQMPGGDLDALPLVLMGVVAAGLVAAGFVGFRRRDVQPD
jgi:ABC-2 type transport system permease protein